MKKYINMAMVYVILGLGLGVFYREFTKLNDFSGETVLSAVHTHILVLGFMFMLMVLMLDKLFHLTEQKGMRYWFVGYNGSLIYVVATMVARGVADVTGTVIPGLNHIAGLGHGLLGISLIGFVVLLKKAI